MIGAGPSIVHLAEFVNGYPFKPEDLGSDGVPVIRIRQLLDADAETDRALPPANAVWVTDGDLVFSWSATLSVRIWDRGPALLNQHLFRVDVHPGLDRRWVRYVLEVAIERLRPLMHGSAMTHITRDMLRLVTTLVPSAAEQRAMANYLDAETARIDGLIRARREVATLLRERRKVFISSVTTQGGAGLKSHGANTGWPPSELPRGWDLVQMRHLARIGRGASPRPIDDPAWFDVDGDYGWVRISDVTASGRYLESTEQRLSKQGAARSVKLQPGALILSIAASVGNPIITSIPCCIHDGFVYFSDLQHLTPEYLYYLLLGGEMFGGLGKLGTQLNLNTDTVGDIKVPVPSLEEQRGIVALLDKELAGLDTTLRLMEGQVQLMLERRQALIARAVTGAVEIEGAAV